MVFHFRTIRLQQDGSLDEGKLAESVVDDSRLMGTGPFELLIGRDFKFKVWEDCVKEMLIGEVSRYYCPYKAGCSILGVCAKLRPISVPFSFEPRRNQIHTGNHISVLILTFTDSVG